MATPPGWFPDAQDQSIVRWWDGQQWTGHTQPLVTPPPGQGFVTAREAQAGCDWAAAADRNNSHAARPRFLPAALRASFK
ncbi:DUF2510 domain-containing protein [Nocardioides sp. Leaf374]|uniref:DUF2510 domain-containing protein n=1 Tax=Nocardioides sp. Leaf374 TaxID=2876560 RepID=UPI003A5CFC82